MPGRVLVAGASGALGREVLRELVRRGRAVQALVHCTPLPSDLQGRIPTVRGDALDVADADRAARGCDVVFSCLGASVAPSLRAGRLTYDRVDRPANLNLLRSALREGATRFVYVSVAGHRRLGHLGYVRAHEAVVGKISGAEIQHCVVRPTGLYSAFTEVLKLAQKGFVPVIGDGSARTNPIHDRDLAATCLDAIEGEGPEMMAGGPDVLTRREIAELAIEAVGRPARVRSIPPSLVRLVAGGVRPFNPRVGDITDFYAEVSVRDVVAPVRGARKLSEYFDDALSGP